MVKKMIGILNKKRWAKANDKLMGNEEREWAFVGTRENFVIDYIILNEEIKGKLAPSK